VKAPEIDPGALRNRVTIEAATPTPDGAGGETVTWSSVATAWAAVDTIGAGEAAVAGHTAGVATHRITMRFRDDLAGGMRVAWRGRTFRVLTASDPDESRRFLVIETLEERS
jgi:SPP1 family predicted phage head-tail adaptor